MLASVLAKTVLNKSIMIDILIAEFSEPMTACLMLDNASEIIRISEGTHRTASYGRAIRI